jgi:hypothetical protein
MALDKAQVGLTGEYYVLAQLSARGFVPTLTLSNTKGVDILVANQNENKLFKIEVKTTTHKPRKEKLFSDKRTYQWAMTKKHENIRDKKLIYCFVYIKNEYELPEFFLVPSKKVADYVKWEHDYWLKTREKQVKDTTMRRFRIEEDDPNGYKDNWAIFQ